MPKKSRMEIDYRERIVPELQKQLELSSVMAVPKLEKIVINMGVGEVREDVKQLDAAMADLAAITGQKPVATKAKKSISNFKIREGLKVGCKVTLRGRMMYDFLDRFISIAVPRIRDFRGLPNKSFDGRGNYSLGMKEQVIFPEMEYDKIDRARGMDICIVTTARDDREGYALLRALGMPFQEK
jgi:large subunit ribosomal protein L5